MRNHAAALRAAMTIVLFMLAIDSAPAGPQPSAVLSVRVEGLHSETGHVGCTLYKSADGFPTDASKAMQLKWCPILKSSATCRFDPIPAGIYAVACFHDENNNKVLDRGPFGIPSEGTVASNHAKGLMGPPHFDKAKFQFKGVPTELELRISY